MNIFTNLLHQSSDQTPTIRETKPAWSQIMVWRDHEYRTRATTYNKSFHRPTLVTSTSTERNYQRFDVIGQGRDLLVPFKEERHGKQCLRELMQKAIEQQVLDPFSAHPDFSKSGTRTGPQPTTDRSNLKTIRLPTVYHYRRSELDMKTIELIAGDSFELGDNTVVSIRRQNFAGTSEQRIGWPSVEQTRSRLNLT